MGPCRAPVRGDAGAITAASLSLDGRLVVCAYEDKTLGAWDLERGSCVRVLKGLASPARAVAVLPGGDCALSSEEGGFLRLWDLKTGACLRTAFGSSLAALCADPGGTFAVGGGADGTLDVIDCRSAERVCSLRAQAAIASVAASAEGAFTAGADGVRAWEFDWEYRFPAAAQRRAAPAGPAVRGWLHPDRVRQLKQAAPFVAVGLAAVLFLLLLLFLSL